MARKFGKAEHPPPDSRVRQSEALTNYAPGAMVDLLHDAVLVGGLDFWGKNSFAQRFDEPRLRRRLERQFPELRDDKPSVMPPEGDERNPTRRCGIQVLEFPSWFVCQKASCGRTGRRRTDHPSQSAGVDSYAAPERPRRRPACSGT
jgi:hypothetical protein